MTFLNVHEPIIDRPTWEKVQALKAGTRRKRPTVTQAPSVFSGYLKCPECGGNLNFHFNQGNHDIKFFSCQNHNSGLRKCSSTHYIRLDFLEQVVLYEIHRLACFANEYENDFIKAMVGRSAKVAENDRVRKKRELDGLLAQDKELDMLFERLYEDNVSGKIDDARFAKMSKRYEQEQGENTKKIKALRLAQTPTTGTLRPCKAESKNWDDTQNLYIEGDNLEVLKLLQKNYHGKIKMIFIDPPYNTGSDFVYPDNFADSIENYKQITGQVDDKGKSISANSELSGRFHTDWLNMMYPRLRLARNLLRDDGVIFISLDDTEIDNLKKMCNEVFGEHNFVAWIIWQHSIQPKGYTDTFSLYHNHILC
ncbi:Adenine specific DNA methylase Mod [uncultured Flavonifractor sp.]|nr:Adenine specific DNA methylase Mod [uncultured Flavonifractor sp.]